eukprot:c27585_g2_i1 orf=270-2021(+)
MKMMLQKEDGPMSYKRVKRDGNLGSQSGDEGKFGASTSSSFILENPPILVQGSENNVHPWNNMMPTMSAATLFNPLDEPSPLGLSLRKSPSLLDLIQRKLAQGDAMMLPCSQGVAQESYMSKSKNCMTLPCVEKDKVKAANFPVVLLRIGTWECASRYEGDLVAKCYYAKQKLVWEVLDRGLKSKIEIQWSEITALKASCSEDQLDSLDIELSKPPLFFSETNPQPRKHTSWKSASDFTGGQATVCRRHFLQFSEGILNRHLEKLFQCEPRLKALNERTSVIKDSLFFDLQIPFDNQQELHHQDNFSYQDTRYHMLFKGVEPLQHIGHDHLMNKIGGLHPNVSPMCGMIEPARSLSDSHGCEVASPSSVIDAIGTEESSSSESEDVISRYDALDGMQVHKTEVATASASCQGGPYSTTTNMLSSVSTNASSLWKLGSNAYDGVPRNMKAADRQVLNDIALHLLGEPLSLAEGQKVDDMPSVSAQHMRQENSFVQLPHELLDHVLSEGREDSSQSHKDKANGWFGDYFCLADNSRTLFHAGQMANSELKPICPTSHSSHADLLYLPHIPSLPQLFSSNCTSSYP